MIFSTFCNFYLFLFLLFFLSSKSLIYKITQKINVLPYKIIRIKRTHQYRKNTVKGICKAKVIVATKQIREIIMLKIKYTLLFFIEHQLTHLPNKLACIWNIYVRSAHIAVNLCTCFIRKIAKCQDVKSFLSAYGAPWLFALSPIPHLLRFFFCAVIKAFYKGFCL